MWYGRHTPYTLREAMVYQIVFDELLAHSPAPAADARELGLDPDWVRFTGANPYATDSPLLEPAFRRELLHRVGYRKIVWFYLRHTSRLLARVERASRDAWSLRPTYGNFEKSAEHPQTARAVRFSAWSRARGALGAVPLLSMATLLGVNAFAAAATHRRATARGRFFREGVLLLVAMAALAFAVCALAQAPPDLSRALYAYHALCDLLLVADAGWIAETIARSVRRKRAGATSVLYERPVGIRFC